MTTKRDEVISKIRAGEMKLSFSAIKEFRESPSHFIRYKTGEKKETDAMRLGTLIHCAILEPEELDKRYLVFDRAQMPFPNSTLNKKENKEYKLHLEALAASQDKKLVDASDYNLSIAIRDLVRGNEPARIVLEKCYQFEKPLNWEFDGFNWRGYADGVGMNHIVDLKKVRDASPEKIQWEAKRNRWHWQAYLYARAINPKNPFSVKYYNLCVSESDYGVSVNQIGWHLLSLAESELKETTEAFRQCMLLDHWDANYDYWSDNGVYTIE